MVQIKTSILSILALGSMGIGGSATTITNSLLLSSISEQLSFPASTWSANGTHTAKGFTTESADTANAEGLKQDCDNINLNKKLAIDFRSDVLGSGATGFFYRCEKVTADTNKYWFTISAADKAQIDQLCDPDTTYPIVYDKQHNTWFIDEPFNCTRRTNPTDFFWSKWGKSVRKARNKHWYVRLTSIPPGRKEEFLVFEVYESGKVDVHNYLRALTRCLTRSWYTAVCGYGWCDCNVRDRIDIRYSEQKENLLKYKTRHYW